MGVKEELEKILTEKFCPEVLEVVNDSPRHNVPDGSESHFFVLIVSNQFLGLSLIKRHQMVHNALENQIKNKIHAFSQQTLTPEEFMARGGTLPPTPCVKKG